MTTEMNEVEEKIETTIQEMTDIPILPIPSASSIEFNSNSLNKNPDIHTVQEQIPQDSSIANDEKNLYVSENCTANKGYRVQWEAEINPRCRGKTALTMGSGIYLFDGFYIVTHSDTPPIIPPFEYVRSNVHCKVEFILEDLPETLRLNNINIPEPIELEDPTHNDPNPTSSTRSFQQSLYLFQHYLFRQLLGIQIPHLFRTIRDSNAHLNPDVLNGNPHDCCSDFHLVPRFISVNEGPILNKDDLDTSNRIGFAIGTLLPIEQVLEFLETTSKYTADVFLHQFSSKEIIDCIISTRINGEPAALRIDDIIEESMNEESDDTTQKKKTSLSLLHTGKGAVAFDGTTSEKKIKKWRKFGEFLQISPVIEARDEKLRPEECHLTGLRTDVFEIASAMPMLLKHIRHMQSLTLFSNIALDYTFKQPWLLRQAFTHSSYIDVGLQHVNTVEATRAREQLAHVFEHSAYLKRDRRTLDQVAANTDRRHESFMQQTMEQYVNGTSEFQAVWHSKYLAPYERLEFLGDAVLSFLIAVSSFLKLPTEANEEVLHKIRVEVTNNATLGTLALAASFDTLFLSAFDIGNLAEEKKCKIVADCFEALLGAMFLDNGGSLAGKLKESPGILACRALLGRLMKSHVPDLHGKYFLSTTEITDLAATYIEVDRDSFQASPHAPKLRLRHRMFHGKTGIKIERCHLWIQTMTHPSFTHSQIDEGEWLTTDPHYERIEFIGDAVLQLLSSEFLFKIFPNQQEHLLTQARSSLVKNKRLAIVAQEAGYEEFIRLGKLAKKKNSTLYLDDVLADVFEATLGGMFLESPHNLDAIQAVLQKHLFPLIEKAIKNREWMSPKMVFAHHMQLFSRINGKKVECKFKKIVFDDKSATEKTLKTENENHAVALYVNGTLVSRAYGRTIVQAQDNACAKGLIIYGLKQPHM